MPNSPRLRKLTQVLLSACVCIGLQAAGGRALAQTQQQKDVLWIIPHTHWEGAVFKTREEYLQMGLINITAALHILGEHPDYRFVLDQVAYVRPYLERFPENAAAFRKYIKEGRLLLVGGTDIMPDVNMPSGESFVHQMLYGKSYYRDELGVDVTVGWNLDTFGHNAQMPQILKLAGYKSYWFFRGVATNDTPSEFLWQGIDGTQIPAFWLPFGYSNFFHPPADAAEFERFARERFSALDPFARGHDRVAMDGADVSEPEGYLPEIVRQFNQKGDAPFTLKIGLPTDFEAVVAKRAGRPVVGGELNPIFQGIYSSRIELKQRMRKMENLLSSAEKLAALAHWMGAPQIVDELMRAWEPVLFNQTHDLASGVMVDKVYDDVVRGYNFSERLTDQLLDASEGQIDSRIDTRGEGIPIVVFNTLGWPRNDVAEADVDLTEAGFVDLSLMDSDGKSVPVQLFDVGRYGDGGIRHAHLVFVARGVPALGYAVFHVVPRKEFAPSHAYESASTRQQDNGTIENEYFRASFKLWTGEMTSLVDKSTGWEALRAPGNVVAQEQDGGDLWQLYGNLNGGRNIAMTRPILLPDKTRSRFSSEWIGGSGHSFGGPVFSQYYVSHPFANGSFSTRVRLYSGVRRVDIETEILNNDAHVRYRVLFPAAVKDGKRTDEIPFGAIERPQGQEFPAQNWMDYGDGAHGLTLLNCAMPGNNVADGTLMLSLLRSAAITAYGFGGGYEPGVSSDSGLEMGRTLTLHYSLVPHAGDWRDAGVSRAGWEINQPLIVRKVTAHPGTLPARWGWLETSAPNVNVSALKPARDGSVMLRVYEAAGRVTSGVTVKLHTPVVSVHEADLMEDEGQAIATEDDSFKFDLHPYEIRTFKLRLRPPDLGSAGFQK